MGRRNQERHLEAPELTIPGFHAPKDIQTAVAPERRRTDRPIKYPDRSEQYEQYGPAHVRAAYLEASLGRPVVDDSLTETIERYRRLVSLKVEPLHGLVYIAGTELAGKTRFGMLSPEKPRLSPEEVVTLAVTRMQQEKRLAESSLEPVTVPFNRLFVKRWGSQTVKLVARLGDVPTSDYLASGQLLGEKASVMHMLGGNAPNRSRPLEQIEHFITIGSAPVEESQFLKAQLADEPLAPDASITLGKVGYLYTPLPTNR